MVHVAQNCRIAQYLSGFSVVISSDRAGLSLGLLRLGAARWTGPQQLNSEDMMSTQDKSATAPALPPLFNGYRYSVTYDGDAGRRLLRWFGDERETRLLDLARAQAEALYQAQERRVRIERTEILAWRPPSDNLPEERKPDAKPEQDERRYVITARSHGFYQGMPARVQSSKLLTLAEARQALTEFRPTDDARIEELRPFTEPQPAEVKAPEIKHALPIATLDTPDAVRARLAMVERTVGTLEKQDAEDGRTLKQLRTDLDQQAQAHARLLARVEQLTLQAQDARRDIGRIQTVVAAKAPKARRSTKKGAR